MGKSCGDKLCAYASVAPARIGGVTNNFLAVYLFPSGEQFVNRCELESSGMDYSF